MSNRILETPEGTSSLAHPKSLPRVCSRCVMDTTFSEIQFDGEGICIYCRRYDELSRALPPPEEATRLLHLQIEYMKKAGHGHDYDCVLGLSGGVDSSFLAYKLKEWGLRPLAVQFDNGWNSELAVKNIEQICRLLQIDLFTYVVDWEEFKDLQLSFLKASVANVELPSDHGISATIYNTALQKGIKYIVNGVNLTTEASVGINDFGYNYADLYHLRAIHKIFGSRPLRTFPQMGYFRRAFLERSGRIKRVEPLNLINYDKQEAMSILQKKLNWTYYGGKHYESIITRFHQAYILPRKFGVEKRKYHLSNLIWSGQMTREDALQELATPVCPPDLLRQDKEFVLKKLGLTPQEFDHLMNSPVKTHRDYPNSEKRLRWTLPALRVVSRGFRLLRSMAA